MKLGEKIINSRVASKPLKVCPFIVNFVALCLYARYCKLLTANFNCILVVLSTANAKPKCTLIFKKRILHQFSRTSCLAGTIMVLLQNISVFLLALGGRTDMEKTKTLCLRRG